MNQLQKQNLMKRATEFSRRTTDTVYVLIKDNFGKIATNCDVITSYLYDGYKVYAKLREGGLVL